MHANAKPIKYAICNILALNGNALQTWADAIMKTGKCMGNSLDSSIFDSYENLSYPFLCNTSASWIVNSKTFSTPSKFLRMCTVPWKCLRNHVCDLLEINLVPLWSPFHLKRKMNLGLKSSENQKSAGGFKSKDVII
jgi:hypothetical protein